MTIQNTFHKAAGETSKVLASWIKSRDEADNVLEIVESQVRTYAKKNNISFREAKKQFPSYKEAQDNYNFWCDNVTHMRSAQKEALAIW